MKKMFKLVGGGLIVLGLATSAGGIGTSRDTPEQLPVPNPGILGDVKVIYETRYEGKLRCTRTVWIEDGGERCAELEVIPRGNGEIRTFSYWNGKQTFILRDGENLKAFDERWFTVDPIRMARADRETMVRDGYRKVGVEVVDSNECQMWFSDRVWKGIPVKGRLSGIWKGIRLISRADRKADGSYRSNTVALSVEEGVRIPAKIRALAGE